MNPEAINFDLIDEREYFVHEGQLYVKIKETLAKEIQTNKIFEFDADTKVTPVDNSNILKSELREAERLREQEMKVSGKSVFTMNEESKKRSQAISKAREEKHIVNDLEEE